LEPLSHEALARFVSILRNEAKIRYSKASGGIGIRLAITAAMSGERSPSMKVKFTKRALAKLDALGTGITRTEVDCVQNQDSNSSRNLSASRMSLFNSLRSSIALLV